MPTPLNEFRVNFSAVIKAIKEQLPGLHRNTGYIWLQAFKDKEQKQLNSERSTIVHHVTTSTTFREQHRVHVHNRAALEVIMEERFSRPDFYKEHISLSLTALNQALELICELSPVAEAAPAVEDTQA